MQFMPEMPPSCYLPNGTPAELANLTDRARGHVESAITKGLDIEQIIVITVDGDDVTVTNATPDIVEAGQISSSLDEINSLLTDGLPAMYTRDEQSQSEDSIYASHLSDNWGF